MSGGKARARSFVLQGSLDSARMPARLAPDKRKARAYNLSEKGYMLALVLCSTLDRELMEQGYFPDCYMAFCLSVSVICILSSVSLLSVPVTLMLSAAWYFFKPSRVSGSSLPVCSPA